jgi:hypothetical protein
MEQLCTRCMGVISDPVFANGGVHIDLADCVEHQTDRIFELEKRLVTAERNASTAAAVLERLDRAGRL